MQRAIDETDRRRAIQVAYNEAARHRRRAASSRRSGTSPTASARSPRSSAEYERPARQAGIIAEMPKDELARLIKDLENADEDGGQEARVREGGAAARPDRRAAADHGGRPGPRVGARWWFPSDFARVRFDEHSHVRLNPIAFAAPPMTAPRDLVRRVANRVRPAFRCPIGCRARGVVKVETAEATGVESASSISTQLLGGRVRVRVPDLRPAAASAPRWPSHSPRDVAAPRYPAHSSQDAGPGGGHPLPRRDQKPACHAADFGVSHETIRAVPRKAGKVSVAQPTWSARQQTSPCRWAGRPGPRRRSGCLDPGQPLRRIGGSERRFRVTSSVTGLAGTALVQGAPPFETGQVAAVPVLVAPLAALPTTESRLGRTAAGAVPATWRPWGRQAARNSRQRLPWCRLCLAASTGSTPVSPRLAPPRAPSSPAASGSR